MFDSEEEHCDPLSASGGRFLLELDPFILQMRPYLRPTGPVIPPSAFSLC